MCGFLRSPGVALAAVAVLLTGVLAVAAETSPVSAWQKKIPGRFFAYYKEGVKVDGDLADWNLKEGLVEISTDTSALTPRSGAVESRLQRRRQVRLGP